MVGCKWTMVQFNITQMMMVIVRTSAGLQNEAVMGVMAVSLCATNRVIVTGRACALGGCSGTEMAVPKGHPNTPITPISPKMMERKGKNENTTTQVALYPVSIFHTSISYW